MISQTVSVAIITRNRSNLLRKTLKSIEIQTRSPDEVVIVDNNSSDETRECIQEYSDKLPIRYVHFGGTGFGNARNCALRHCTGEIIAFIDDDAVAEKCWIQTLEATFNAYPNAVAVQGNMVNMFPRSSAAACFQLLCQDLPKLKYRNGNQVVSSAMICTANFAFRKGDILSRDIWFDPDLPRGEDRYFGYCILREGMGIVHCPQAIVRHHWSTSKRDFLRKRVLAAITRVELKRWIPFQEDTAQVIPFSLSSQLRTMIRTWQRLSFPQVLQAIMLTAAGKGLVGLGYLYGRSVLWTRKNYRAGSK